MGYNYDNQTGYEHENTTYYETYQRRCNLSWPFRSNRHAHRGNPNRIKA